MRCLAFSVQTIPNQIQCNKVLHSISSPFYPSYSFFLSLLSSRILSLLFFSRPTVLLPVSWTPLPVMEVAWKKRKAVELKEQKQFYNHSDDNDGIHPRNKYSSCFVLSKQRPRHYLPCVHRRYYHNPPSFQRLASQYPKFAPFVSVKDVPALSLCLSTHPHPH